MTFAAGAPSADAAKTDVTRESSLEYRVLIGWGGVGVCEEVESRGKEGLNMEGAEGGSPGVLF